MAGRFSRRSFLGGTGTMTASVIAATAPATLLASGTAHAEIPVEDGAAGFTFAHPGILHTQEDLDRMRTAVAAKEDPVYSGYQVMAADSRSSYDYTAANTGQITTWGRGPYNYQDQAPNDAAAAYQNALMWYITQDVRYADKARDIVNIWSRTLEGITGADGELGASLQGFKFVNAAEILRHTGYDGWAAEDIARCEKSLKDVWYKAQSGYALFANGGWDAGIIQTVLGIGVFCDDRVMFEDAVRYAAAGAGNGSIRHRIINTAGQGQESGRDQTHEQLALGLLAGAAQVAWNQGVDLFGFAGNRILAGYEYDAKYNLGNDDVSFVADLDRTGKYIKTKVTTLVRGLSRPIFELAYAHYVSVLGLPAPYTKQAVFRGTDGARFVEGYDQDHPSWGTLTCAREAPTSSTPVAPPGAPAGLTASNGSDSVDLAWVGSVDPASATSAATYSVARASTSGGTYQTIATGLTATKYIDLEVTIGTTYYYTVTATNAVGTSVASLEACATAGLPSNWSSRNVGTVQASGLTTFDGERFTLEASGADIAGTADSFRIAQMSLSGNVTITARVVYPLSSQYGKVGVMMRSSTAAGSAHAAMLLQGLTLAAWSGVWTTRDATGATTSATGSTPVPPAQQTAISTAASYPISNLGSLPDSATPLSAPYVEAAGDGYRMRMPYWVRLERVKNTFTGSISPDGVHWTEVGSTELDLGTTVYVGLVNCSCLGVAESYAETGTAAFDNITVVRKSSTHWQVAAPKGTVTALAATTGTSAIELTWSDTDLSGRYTVKRATSPGGPYEAIATGVGPVGFGVHTGYRDPTGTPGTTYYYVIAKTNVGGAGPVSAEVDATMPTPPAPKLRSASAAYANTGVPFEYLIGASNDPASFNATGLPAGLSVSAATGLISGTPTGTGDFTVRISATNAAGTDTATLELGVGTPPPAPWSYQDIGDYVLDERLLGIYGVVSLRTPGITGYDSTDASFTVRGAGTDLNVNGQGMTAQYTYLPVTGDTTFIARVASRTNAGNDDQVGLLMTQSLSPFGQMAGAILTSTGGGDTGVKQFVRRQVVAGGTTTTNASGSGVATPTWLRMERSGNKFTASASTDGTTWSVIGRDTISTFGSAPFYVGFAVTSRTPSALNTTVFDHVSVTAGATTVLGQPVQAPYQTFTSATAATAAYGQSGTDLAIYGDGTDVWGNTDQYSAIYLTGALPKASIATVAVTSQDSTAAWARAGIMVRDDITGTGTSPGYLTLSVTPGHGVALQWDSDGDGTLDRSVETDGSTSYPTWLKLVRSGTDYIGYCSTNGNTWTTVGTATVASAVTGQDVGAFTTAASSTATESDFSEFTVTAQTLAQVLARARETDQAAWTQESYAAFTAELDRIETEGAKPGADEDALIDEVFTAYDLLDPSHVLVAGAARSLQSVNVPDYYAAYGSDALGLLGQVTENSSDTVKKQAGFAVVAGLADATGFSFRSADGRYLRHYSFRIRLDASDGSDTFEQDATFHAVTGSQNESVRLMSHNFPTRCIRHRSYQLWVDEYSTSDAPIQDDSSFIPVGAWT
ncbi:AbfB domain-containing protein [Streptomyces sp. NBC_00620]|uniref:AbfB domain-containing protein n=1 Tax=Streptomyces sp. NBC_00620 TaxID=2903666 RepID=UPI00225AAC7F|nr:AbfB domain-containing protein [Streptomyces sp. NBC_00620]MCX4977079.1 AbfB domain-containing protein [Streptomyces sp. NBC_00620]